MLLDPSKLEMVWTIGLDNPQKDAVDIKTIKKIFYKTKYYRD